MTESTGVDSGDGGGRECAELLIDGGVDIGLSGGEALRRRFVRRDAKKAVPPSNIRRGLSTVS